MAEVKRTLSDGTTVAGKKSTTRESKTMDANDIKRSTTMDSIETRKSRDGKSVEVGDTRKSREGKSMSRDSAGNIVFDNSEGNTKSGPRKSATRDSKGNMVIRTPDGKITDSAPNPVNRRRPSVAPVQEDDRKEKRGILKKSGSFTAIGEKKDRKEGRRGVSRTSQNKTNTKRPKLKQKSPFEKLAHWLGLAGHNVALTDPYALEVIFTFSSNTKTQLNINYRFDIFLFVFKRLYKH